MRDLVTPEDLRGAAAAVLAALWPHRDADWSPRAGELDWTCLDTLGHTVEALRFYAVLVHDWDVACGLGVELEPPAELAARVRARLFPWVEPAEGERPWDLLRWCNGRLALPGRERLTADWWWHCAPIQERDGGGPRVRTEPPPR